MPNEHSLQASVIDSVFMPLNENTHNVYAIKGNKQAMTFIKIGVALENSQGDFQLFINPKHATGKLLLFKKNQL